MQIKLKEKINAHFFHGRHQSLTYDSQNYKIAAKMPSMELHSNISQISEQLTEQLMHEYDRRD